MLYFLGGTAAIAILMLFVSWPLGRQAARLEAENAAEAATNADQSLENSGQATNRAAMRALAIHAGVQLVWWALSVWLLGIDRQLWWTVVAAIISYGITGLVADRVYPSLPQTIPKSH